MEAASIVPATSSSSKVILQCTDPANVFDSFQSLLEPRTPLKNLHWKSPSRPLRSIPTLNVTLSKKESTANGLHAGGRRHQIPGLRETPYLKLYLLRCDDKETYKETARKEIKQWIKDNTFEKESKSTLRNQEHHDAFEWMVVHVVVPGTAAAAQPVSSKHLSLNDTESTDSLNSKSKWTGKSTSTIYDKLRADFSSSKLSSPRVAQVRLTDSAKPSGALAPQEIQDQLSEFIDNLKASILKSFDTRVAQYEDDIKEREAQRALPGWNFCTFFILKEGLARGFENVGLLDDALAVYSELEAGLDTVIKEQDERDDGDTSGALLPHANNLKSIIRDALDQEMAAPEDNAWSGRISDVLVVPPDLFPFDVRRRKYRDLILANEVSPLDTRIYIFTRQSEILMRRAKTASFSGKPGAVDHQMVADFAELSLQFINLAARELRADMQNAWGGRLSGEERATQKVVIGNVVAAWSWSAVAQTLELILPLMATSLTDLDTAFDVIVEESELKRATARPTTPNGHSAASSTSSSPQRGLRQEPLSRIASQTAVEELPAKLKQLKAPGIERLTAAVARLLLLARKVVENIPSTASWVNKIRDIDVEGYNDASKTLHRLSSTTSIASPSALQDHDGQALQSHRIRGLNLQALQHVAISEDHFYQLYSVLTKAAHHLFVEAGSKHAARQLLTDLAMLAYSQKDDTFACECLSTVFDGAKYEQLVTAQPHILAIYAQCLRSADKPDDLAMCLLAYLQITLRQSSHARQKMWDEFVEAADQSSAFSLPLALVAEVLHVDRAITHTDRVVGFELGLTIRGILNVRLGSAHSPELMLRSCEQQEPYAIYMTTSAETIPSTKTRLTFCSNVSTQGWYQVEALQVRIGKITFEHRFSGQDGPSQRGRHAEGVPLLLHVHPSAPWLDVRQSERLHLDESRRLLMTLTSRGAIGEPTLRLRPATAGLRLLLQQAKVVGEGEVSVLHENDATLLRLQEFSSTSIEIDIPYSLEDPSEPLATVKCLLEYTACGVAGKVYQSCAAEAALLVSVNVQHIFRETEVYSHFLIAPATAVPIIHHGCDVADAIEQCAISPAQTTLFSKQPARWLVKSELNKTLPLSVRYQKIDELAVNSIRSVLTEDLCAAGFDDVARLLSLHLVQAMRERWRSQDMEQIGLSHEVIIWPMDELDWHKVLAAFEREVRAELSQWLDRWHADHRTIPLRLADAPIRELQLRLQLPSRPTIATGSIQARLAEGQTVVLGQPMVCDVAITIAGPVSDDIQYSYELFAPNEVWLIGGRRKGVFTNLNNFTVPVMLVAQKTGPLLLPAIDIRCRKRGDNHGRSVEVWDDVLIEVYDKTASSSLLATTSLRSSTLGLMNDEALTAGEGGLGSMPGVLLDSKPL
jgi:trafficking protein particle complex subunit 10